MSEDAAALRRVSVNDLAIDHALAQMSRSMRFLLDVTPVNADDIKAEFVAGRVSEPRFVYRELEADQEVLKQVVTNIDVSQVEDTTVASLLRAKHRELLLQIDMLMARDSDVFRQLSTELYGGTSPRLREQAENILAAVPTPETKGEGVTAEEFLGLAQAEIDHYTGIDPGIDIHAEVRDDVNGVVVSGNTLLIDPDATVQRARADALLQHEVGTHLVTQVNGSAQPIQVLGTGLAFTRDQYDDLTIGELTAFA